MACDWLLVDGSSMIFRAFYGSKTTIDGPGGMQVNAIGGFFDRPGNRFAHHRAHAAADERILHRADDHRPAV